MGVGGRPAPALPLRRGQSIDADRVVPPAASAGDGEQPIVRAAREGQHDAAAAVAMTEVRRRKR